MMKELVALPEKEVGAVGGVSRGESELWRGGSGKRAGMRPGQGPLPPAPSWGRSLVCIGPQRVVIRQDSRSRSSRLPPNLTNTAL